MRISDWSSDVCSSDLMGDHRPENGKTAQGAEGIGGTVRAIRPVLKQASERHRRIIGRFFGFAFVTHRLGPQCPVSPRPPCRLRPQAPLADFFEHRLFSLVRAGLGTRQIKAAAGGHGGAPFRPGGQPSISATIRCSSRRESPCGRLVSEETLEEAPMVATGRLDRLSKWFLVVICMISCADFPRLLIIELNGACCAPRRDLRPGYVHER